MINDESTLLYNALKYEEGHERRTQHILKVYSLTKLIGEQENISNEDMIILNASAILHDICIKYCKEKYSGDASLENQKMEAPYIVEKFLKETNYTPSYIPKIIELVKKHHDYDDINSILLQILIEADLIINYFETENKEKTLKLIKNIFKTETGKNIFNSFKLEEI